MCKRSVPPEGAEQTMFKDTHRRLPVERVSHACSAPHPGGDPEMVTHQLNRNCPEKGKSKTNDASRGMPEDSDARDKPSKQTGLTCPDTHQSERRTS